MDRVAAWCNQMIGMSGSSAGATTTFAAASQRHPCLRAFFAQAGGSSIYDDVVYEGNAIEMERLWLWVSKNIRDCRHRIAGGHAPAWRDRGRARSAAVAAGERCTRLEAARQARVPFVGSEDWMRLP
jgi:predicted acyl esterase